MSKIGKIKQEITDKTLLAMIAKMRNLDAARLKEVLIYDAATGVFSWRLRRNNRAEKGDVAGFTENGYVLIGIDGVRYQAHLLAWVYMRGVAPEHFIDHKDGDRSNNRWSNLRPATRSQNNRNSAVRKHNKVGLKGVQVHRNGKFKAKIQFEGKQHYLGLFDTAEEASQAYKNAAEKHFGEFARSK